MKAKHPNLPTMHALALDVVDAIEWIDQKEPKRARDVLAEVRDKLRAATPQVAPTERNFCTGDQDCRHACELELEQEADGRWIAEFLRFTGVMAYGKSPEEAIRNAAKVLIEPCDHFWRTIPVNPRWSWFTECEKCKIGAPMELQAENYVEGSSPGTTKGTKKD